MAGSTRHASGVWARTRCSTDRISGGQVAQLFAGLAPVSDIAPWHRVVDSQLGADRQLAVGIENDQKFDGPLDIEVDAQLGQVSGTEMTGIVGHGIKRRQGPFLVE